MGLFDKLRSKPPRRPPSPDELFAALAQAITEGDGPRFEALCREHTAAIVDAFEIWRRPGKDSDPESLRTIVQVLGTTAQYLAEVLDRPEPWALLTGGPGENPFERWAAAQREIMRRVEVLDYDGAVAGARELLAELEGVTGSGREQPEELTRGLLGQLLRQVARPDEAIAHLEWTLARCEAQGDDEGVGIYLRELHEADRDRGRPSAWALRLAAHAERVGDHERARWLRAVARRFPDGEPSLRMVVVVDGRRFELDDDALVEPLAEGGHVQVLFERNRQTLAPAQKWIERGRDHGSRGEHEDAIACFTAAAEADVHDPESRSLHAFSLMLMDRAELALPLYDEVERLAPGWFHARTWRSLARRRLDGAVAHPAIELIHTLEDGALAPEQRLKLASEALTRWPRVPELHLLRGKALQQLGRDPEHAWLAGLEVCGDVPSTRSRLLYALGRLEEVVAIDGGNSMALAAATMQLRVRARG